MNAISHILYDKFDWLINGGKVVNSTLVWYWSFVWCELDFSHNFLGDKQNEYIWWQWSNTGSFCSGNCYNIGLPGINMDGVLRDE